MALPTEPGIYPGIPDDVYHASRDTLSSSGARKLLPPSCPAIFKQGLDHPQESTATFDIGKAAHTLILDAGQEVGPVPFDNWTTKAAKQARDSARADGWIPLLQADYQMVCDMERAVDGHPLAAALLAEGTPELSGVFNDAETGALLRFRPDWLTELSSGRIAVVDLKTSQSASPQEFASSAAKFGYALQQEWYCQGLRALEIAEDPIFLFLVVSKTPPYLVSVVALDDDAVAYGRRQMRRAIDTYAKCTAADDWPGYPATVHTVGLPRWTYSQEGPE